MTSTKRAAPKMNETVWKTEKTEYYTRATKGGNRACARKVVYWSAMVDGKAVRGFATRGQALAASWPRRPEDCTMFGDFSRS